MQKGNWVPHFKRLIILVILTSFAMLVINEITFTILNENIDRAPMQIELLILLGPARKFLCGKNWISVPHPMCSAQ